MSAPSSSRIPRAVRWFAILAIGFALVAGCAAPGASRLQGPPEDLPPSLSYVTADVLGFSLVATDAAKGTPEGDAMDAWCDDLGIDRGAASSWIGDHAGVAVRQLDVEGVEGGTKLWFADVKDPQALVSAIDELEADGREAQFYKDGVIVATSGEALQDFIEAADEYAVPERKAMAQYAAEVATKVPVGAVFRADLIRTGIRTPVQDDPVMLEFARWATDSDVLVAFRDGWVGLKDERAIGAVEWVPDLAPDIDWGEADVEMLGRHDEDDDVVVAFEDPGQHLIELVKGITFGNGQYATGQDVPDDDEDRVELEPLLEELDGQAVATAKLDDLEVELQVEDVADGATAKLDDQLCRLDLDAWAEGSRPLVVHVGTARPEPCDPPDSSVSRVQLARKVVSTTPVDRVADARRAGKPPTPPIAWFWTRQAPLCTGPAAGWVAFDGTGEMTFAATCAR